MTEKDIRISLVIPKEMDDYLHEHPEINRSELFRNSVNTIRNPLYKQLSDALVLNFSVMIAIILSFLMLFLTPFVSFSVIFLTWALLTISLVVITTLIITKRRSKVNGRK